MPSALEKTWFTDVNYQVPSHASVALWSKAVLFGIKAALCNEVLDATAPVGSAWTVYGSSDGTTAGLDQVDRVGDTFDSAKWNRHASAQHTWVVLKSPDDLGPYYLTIDYESSADYNAHFIIAKTAPTGGTTSDRPTSVDEATRGETWFLDTASPSSSRMHKVVDADGNFVILWGKNAATRLLGALVFQVLAEPAEDDVSPYYFCIDYAYEAGTTSPLDSQRAYLKQSPGSSGVGRTYNGDALVELFPITFNYSVGDYDLTTRFSAVDPATGKHVSFPIWVFTHGQMASTATAMGIKGRLADFHWGSHYLNTGSKFTRDGVQTHMLCGNMWIPFNGEPFIGGVLTTVTSAQITTPVAPSASVVVPDETPPVVTTISPTADTAIARTTPLVVDVTDETALRRVILVIRYGAAGATELVHDGTSFVFPYATGSTRSVISGGYRFSVMVPGGWQAAPVLSVFSFDTGGNE